MNQTIKTIMNHRSIRKFTNEQLSTKQIETIITSAQYASTSSYVMAYTIIGVTDQKLKEALTAVSGHSHVKDNGHLFIFCADLQRVIQTANEDERQEMKQSIESTEQFIVATMDATLAAQNAAIAAESMGLGICYIGSLRNNIRRVDELLELPNYVIPLFGLVVGYPDEKPESKPRLPIDVVYHENTYDHDVKKQQQLVNKFDEQIKSYYKKRSTNKRVDTWSEQMVRKYSKASRMDVTQFVQDKGLNKR